MAQNLHAKSSALFYQKVGLLLFLATILKTIVRCSKYWPNFCPAGYVQRHLFIFPKTSTFLSKSSTPALFLLFLHLASGYRGVFGVVLYKLFVFHSLRLLPHQQNTGGFFIAVLLKKEDARDKKKRLKTEAGSLTTNIYLRTKKNKKKTRVKHFDHSLYSVFVLKSSMRHFFVVVNNVFLKVVILTTYLHWSVM